MIDFGSIGEAFMTEVLPKIVAMVALIVAATLSGIIAAIVKKEFEWRRVGDFLGSMVLPKMGGWLILEMVALVTNPAVIPIDTGYTHGMLVAMAVAAYAAGVGSLIAQLLANLYEMGVLRQYLKTFERNGG